MTKRIGHPPAAARLLAVLFSVGLVLCAGGPAYARSAGAVSPEIVDSTQRGGMAVALTFDDGPHPDNTPRLLDVLDEHGVRAVFCVLGDQALRYPELVREIVDEGHTLCNHTMSHDDVSGWSPEEVREELLATNAAIHAAAPDARIRYFRAPFGAWGQSPEVAAEMGMRPLGWSVDVLDWSTPGTGVLVDRLRAAITPTSVVLLHDGGGDRSQTVAAVDQLVPEMESQGWRFTRPAWGW
ncbi:polysaccharide deacetylase family protein [Nocardiopsis sp. EMB25]|uniref:polysaccharide deacetylase family protein n=1 Tax=Nocardiopsis sp. EMB25 TaxID=2835867 RepID=UPI0022834E36|nr:polysaccharide deacetylase family protein [Nocardiopsis sp. EMB25]MCY9786582.1 polysaccharide deacetylase family protein [Nocardiopsis sp. EMB25]